MTTHLKLTLHDLETGRDIASIMGELPEVYDTDTPHGAEVSMGNMADGEYSVAVNERLENTPDWHYRAALCHLAMWQYKLGEPDRIKAAEEAANAELSRQTKELANLIEEVITDDRAVRPEIIAMAILSFQKYQEDK